MKAKHGATFLIKNGTTLTQFVNIFIWGRRQREWGQQLGCYLSLICGWNLHLNCRAGLSYNRQEESTDINEVYNGLHEINAKTQSPSHGLAPQLTHTQSTTVYYSTGPWVPSRTWEHSLSPVRGTLGKRQTSAQHKWSEGTLKKSFQDS